MSDELAKPQPPKPLLLTRTEAEKLPCGEGIGFHHWIEMPTRMAYMTDSGTCTKFETLCANCGVKVREDGE